MPGAGSGTLLFGKESSFTGSLSPADTGYHFGRNPSIETLSLDRQLERMREAGVIEDVEAVAQNLEGSLSISAVVNGGVHDDVEDIIFNSGPGNGFATGPASSATVFVGSEYLSAGGSTSSLMVAPRPCKVLILPKRGWRHERRYDRLRRLGGRPARRV